MEGVGYSRITTHKNLLTRRSYNRPAFYDRTGCGASVCATDTRRSSGVSPTAPDYHHRNPQPASGAYPDRVRLPSFTGLGTLLAFQFQCVQLRERVVNRSGVVDTTTVERD